MELIHSKYGVGLAILLLFSCARAPLKNPELAMRKTSAPKIKDDLPLTPLFDAIEKEISVLESNPGKTEFQFGAERFSKVEYVSGLRRFVQIGRSAPTSESFYRAVEREFEFYEVYGQSNWGQVLLTSYFEPVIPGSLKKTDRFSTPLYKVPSDLVNLDLSLFDSKFEHERKYRGRLVGNELRPYFSREEIDVKGSLAGKGLEICWVEPIDAFFLQIQGSGTVSLENGKFLYINYGEKNGHTYESIGKFLKAYIPIEQMNLHNIETFLKALPRDQMQSYLNKNPSYVFFRTSDQHAITEMGVPAEEGRTIATDKKFFPKGALGILSFDKPVFSHPNEYEPSGKQPVSRFVLDQDTGGAITGGGRVDLFWGRGEDSKRHAGVVKESGRLYYIAPKRLVESH